MNSYSDVWFHTFVVPPEQTAKEVDFLVRQLPAHREVLDLCCGSGRHANALAERGYDVTGIDSKPGVFRPGKAYFILGDIRNYALPSARAILVLWQSFGFFTAPENRRLVEQWSSVLKPKGRLILDVYNRDFFLGKDGARTNGGIRETKKLRGRQLSVHLDYPGNKSDDFQWEVFTEAELTDLARQCGLTKVLACSNFQEDQPVSAHSPRMQLVFEKN